MSQGNVCCLCVEICEDSKCLYHEDSGNPNEVHQLMMQYFDAKLLHGLAKPRYKDMCLKCWQLISDFNRYQQSVYQAQQSILLIKCENIQLDIQSVRLSDIQREIKSEDEFLSEQSNESRVFVKEEPALSLCDSFSSANDSSDMVVNHEYDYSVNVFGNSNNSKDLSTAEVSEDMAKLMAQEMRKTKTNRLAVKASDDIIAQWNPSLECVECIENFSTYTKLRFHFKSKHPLVKCQVECCGKYFNRRAGYEDHARWHIDPNAFSCLYCGSHELCRRSLLYHIQKRHPSSVDDETIDPKKNPLDSMPSTTAGTTNVNSDCSVENTFLRKRYINNTDDFIAEMLPVLECELCSEKFTRYSPFRKHFLDKHPRSKCYIRCCQRKLTARYLILDHLRLHANPDVFKCKLCDSRYKQRNHLRVHMETRHNASIKNENEENQGKKKNSTCKIKLLPSRECRICGDKLRSPGQLSIHFKNSHPDEEFYVECCQQKIKSLGEIKAHVRYHVKPTSYKCDACFTCYANKRNLIAHMRIVHKDRIPYKCDYCSTQYSYQNSLIVHMRKVHPNEKMTAILSET